MCCHVRGSAMSSSDGVSDSQASQVSRGGRGEGRRDGRREGGREGGTVDLMRSNVYGEGDRR